MNEQKIKKSLKDRNNEKGAALIMVLMITFLLLVVSAGILLETSTNTANVTDATADQQAYNAAESGIQSAIDVLRNTDTITYAKAVRRDSSNLSTDTSADARLSRWLTYNYTPSGATNPDRITLGSGTYAPISGFAYSVALTDPDNTSNLINYVTTSPLSGFYDSTTKTWKRSMTFGTGVDTATITYIPKTVSGLNVASGSADSDIGSFKVEFAGTGATIPSDILFQIVFEMSHPYIASRIIRGKTIAGTNPNTSPGTVKFDFNAGVFELTGSFITIKKPLPLTPANGIEKTIDISMTNPEPERILIKSTGYGPRGAQKQLEAIIQKNFFEGLSAPAALTLVGSSTGFAFAGGNSNNVQYNGIDVATPPTGLQIPSIGTTNQTNLDYVNNNSTKTPFNPPAADISAELPLWLQSPLTLNATIKNLKDIANASGSYFASGVTPSSFGNNATAQGITFADGDVSLNQSGGGILVCTGTLTFRGGVDFNGLIIVTGAGGFQRSGGGGGTLRGNTVIAPYDPNNLSLGFLGPKYDISGGGNSTLVFDSSSVANGLTAVSNVVLGVAEK